MKALPFLERRRLWPLQKYATSRYKSRIFTPSSCLDLSTSFLSSKPVVNFLSLFIIMLFASIFATLFAAAAVAQSSVVNLLVQDSDNGSDDLVASLVSAVSISEPSS